VQRVVWQAWWLVSVSTFFGGALHAAPAGTVLATASGPSAPRSGVTFEPSAPALQPAPQAGSEVETWVPHGPGGGSAASLRHAPSDPSVVWALASTGVFRSTDGGAHWSLRSFATAASTHGTRLEVAFEDADRVFVAAADGILRTDDGGLTWTRLTPLPALAIDLVLDPSTPGRIYVRSIYQRLYRSDDAGASWRQIRTEVAAVAVAPDGTLTLVRGRDVLRSTSAGQRWTRVAKVPAGLANPRLLVHEPGNPQSLWAGHGQVLWQSGNGGRTWRRVGGPLPGTILRLVHRVDRPRVLYARVFPGGVVKSSDRGVTWTPLVGYGQTAHDFSLRPGQPNELLVGTPDYLFSPGGVWRSTDAGATFQPSQAGFNARQIGPLTVDPRDPEHMFGLSLFGARLYETRDGGGQWELVADGTAGDAMVLEVAFDPFTDQRVFLFDASGRLRRSDDGGETFETVADLAAEGCSSCTTLVVDPHHANRLFAGGIDPTVYRSEDGGESWEPLFAPNDELEWSGLLDVATVPGERDRFLLHGFVYCCSPRVPQQGFRLYETTDDGQSFAPLHDGIPSGYLQSVAYSPLDPSVRLIVAADETLRWANRLYTRTGDQPWTLADENRSWNRIFVANERLWADADTLPTGPTEPPGPAALLASDDGGASWTQVGPDLPPGTRVTGQATVLPAEPPGLGDEIWVPTSNGVHQLVAVP
jgi:photosystem II stability/assembly factor-like uncharacterized protein